MDILVVAAGEKPSSKFFHSLVKTHPRLVAVDGGLQTCLEFGVEPEFVIGDFDSISESTWKNYAHIPTIHMPDQNKFDLEKALEFLEPSDSNSITVCGALGKRIDHTLSNLCLLCRYPVNVIFESETQICFAVSNKVMLPCYPGQTLSLIPFGTEVVNLTTTGLKWELQHAILNKNSVSISNQCTGTSVSIQFDSGDLLVCLIKRLV